MRILWLILSCLTVLLHLGSVKIFLCKIPTKISTLIERKNWRCTETVESNICRASKFELLCIYLKWKVVEKHKIDLLYGFGLRKTVNLNSNHNISRNLLQIRRYTLLVLWNIKKNPNKIKKTPMQEFTTWKIDLENGAWSSQEISC